MTKVDSKRKTKCPLCGARNDARARRCTTCTRPLDEDLLPSQAVFQEAMWSQRIASKGARKKVNPYAVLVLLLIGAVVANYFVFGYGPAWAHEKIAEPKGSTWIEQRSADGYRIDMPGTPIKATRPTPSGASVASMNVWVDSQWDVVKDDRTISTGELLEARNGLYAILATANVAAPTDAAIRTESEAFLAAMLPGSTFTSTKVTQLQDPPYGAHYDIVSKYDAFPDKAGHGTVRARAIIFNGRMFIAATFSDVGDDVALFEHFVANFVPDGSPSALNPTATPPR